MKHNQITFALVGLTIICTLLTFGVGCANVKHALFEPVPAQDGVTNTVGAVQPRQAVVDGIQTTGALFGPQGSAYAGLVTGLLGLLAAGLNRQALKRHLGEAPATPVTSTSDGSRAPP